MRDIGLHDRHVGHPDQAARRLGFRQRDEFVEHGARDAHRDAGDTDRVKPLHGKGIKRAGIAPQAGIFARAGEFFRHEHVIQTIALGRGAAHAERIPVVDRRGFVLREQQRFHRWPAEPVEPAAAIRLNHIAMRAHPGGLTRAAGEMPLAADPIATRNGRGGILVGRSPGDPAARIVVNRLRGAERNERRDQRRAVGDEQVPADRAVVTADLLDRPQINPWLDLIASRRAGQQHSRQTRLDDFRQQRRGDLLIPLDLVSGFGDQQALPEGCATRSRP